MFQAIPPFAPQFATISADHTAQIYDTYTFASGRTIIFESDSNQTTKLLQYKEVSRHTVQHLSVDETQTTYAVIKKPHNIAQKASKLGTLTFTTETFDDGNAYYMASYKALQTNTTPLYFHMYLEDHKTAMNPFTERHTVYPNGYSLQFFRGEWHSVQPAGSSLPKDTTFLANNAFNLYLSKSDVYRSGADKTLVELPDMVKTTQLYQGKHQTEFTFAFPQQKGTTVEQYGFLSDKSLMNWNDAFDVETLRRLDFNNQEKWTSQGPMYLMYPTYTPYTPTSYWAMPANYATVAFIGDASFAPLFHDFGLVQLYKVLSMQNSEGYWPTTPQSNRLKQTYGIGPDFFDTRFNTDFAKFLMKTYRDRLHDPLIKSAVDKYATFLEHYAASHSIATKHGILVSNYADFTKPTVLTSTALNHQLAQLEFLYKYYLWTGDPKVKALAQQYKGGIDDTGTAWIKPDGDLYYQRNPDGTYSRHDYPTLTLHDLIKSQRLITEIDGAPDPVFRKLIEAKTKYCEAHHIPLSD